MRKHRRLIRIAASVYSALAFAYIIFSNETQTGICGYLVALQLKWSGQASEHITMMVAILLFALPLLAVFPALLDLRIPRVDDKLIQLPVTYPARLQSWKMVFAITSIPVILTAGAFAFLRISASRDQAATVYSLDLDAEPDTLATAAKFVEIKGTVRRRFVFGIQDGNATDAYAPLTGSAWTVDKPIKYLLHHTMYGENPVLPVFFREREAAVLTGRIGGALPVSVRDQFTANGLKMDPGCRIVTRVELANGQIPASSHHWIALPVGGLIVLVTFCICALVKVKAGSDVIAETQVIRVWIEQGRTACFLSPDGEEIRFALSPQMQPGTPLRFAGKGYGGGDLYLHLRVVGA